MKHHSERFVITTHDKKLLWDTRKALRLPLPLQSELFYQGGQAFVRDLQSKRVISEFALSNAAGATPFSIPGTTIKISAVQRPLPAHLDLVQARPAIMLGGEVSLFLYEGHQKDLNLFQKIEKTWSCKSFALSVKDNRIAIMPYVSNLILKKQGGLDVLLKAGQNFTLEIKDLAKTEVQEAGHWWRFSAFMPPILLDESEYDLIDPQDMHQDRWFKAAFATVALLAGFLFFQHSSFSSDNSGSEKNVIATIDITIDRSMIDQAKPIVAEVKPVVVPTPAFVPPPVEVKPVAPQPVEMAKATPPPVKAPETKVVMTKKVQVAPKLEKLPDEANYHQAANREINKPTAVAHLGTGSAGTANGGGSRNGAMSAQEKSQQILSRHSKMLQDAFGGVLGLKAGTPGGGTGGGGIVVGNGSAQGGAALAKTSNPNAIGSGFFSGGKGRGPAEAGGDGMGGSGGVAGNMIAGSGGKLLAFVKPGTVGYGADKNGTGYGNGNGKIGVAGQGNGIAYDGVGMIRTGAGLNQSAISAVFRKNAREIRNCYEMLLVNQPDVQGSLTLAFGILPNGAVSKATIKSISLFNQAHKTVQGPELQSCIVKRLSSWTFPKPSDGNPVQVTAYPIELKNVGGQP